MRKKTKKSNKRKGGDYEKKVQATLNSGAIWSDKGDLKTDEFVIECKFTEKKGYRISIKTLKKLWDEALESNKLPLLVIGIQEEDGSRWDLKVEINRRIR